MQRPLVVSTFLVLFFLLQACAPPLEQAAETGLTSIPLTAPIRTLEPTSPPATVMATHMETLEPTSLPATATTTPMPEATATATALPAATSTIAFTRTPLPRKDKTEIPGVDSVIETILSNDLDQRRLLLHFVTSGCTTNDGLGGPPKCAEDQEEGTLIEYLPIGGPGGGSHALSAEVDGVLAFEVEALYAAYRVADDLRDEPEYPHGTYALFFTTAGGDGGSETVVVRVDDEGTIVRLDFIRGIPADFYFQQRTADLMDATPESRMFSSEAAEILLYPLEIQPADGGPASDVGASKPTATSTPYETRIDGRTPEPTATPSPASDSAALAAALPRPLYFLSTELRNATGVMEPQGVWRLDPGSTAVERITSPDLDITSFDVWLGDGRISYGTRYGQIYTIMPDGQSQLLHDASLDAGNDFEIGSLAWSPEGERLAFTIHFEASDRASQEGGLWLMDEDGGAPIKLLDNRYFDPKLDNAAEVRKVIAVDWSPDGSALLLRFGFWENQDMLWLKPLIPDPNEANLVDLPTSWNDGSWAGDSQSILLSGMNRGVFSNLDRVNIDTAGVERLLDGEEVELAILKAQELPAGIAFLGREISFTENTQSYRLYLGQQLADGFEYAQAGPDRPLCSPGYVQDFSWHSEGQVAVLVCDRGLQLIALDGSIDLDLTPYLGPLSGDNNLKVFWEQ
jgi:hypothetical protein